MRSILIPSLVLFGASCFVGCGQDVKPPDFKRMPNRLGLWEGDNTQIPPEILAEIGADVMVNRFYQHSDKWEITISTHIAVFSDWEKGLYHNPLTVYRAAGWKLLDQSYESVYTSEGRSVRASLSMWENNEDRVIVLFWYQLGADILLHKSDLKPLRSKYHDHKKLPRLVKVQLQITDLNTERDKLSLKQLASQIGKWLDEPYYDP